ncbi:MULTISPECIES: hypothetical protein [Oerskovia]|uniref:DUF4239 domain-containing protein n=2 Tax=Oerskovia TaxID=162491 RepID=A0ABR8UXS0_9CELL|nr:MULTISPECIES: hypothetical protein [Oerskovia]MBD7997330.1 hypothetical protein [Oerskovia gallyi]MBM7497723.1 hypothetical protein [Oerskovia paurometabola]
MTGTADTRGPLDAADRGSSDSPGPAASVHRHLELVAAVLLAIATVMTAWSAFQSARWGGEMATSYSAAGAARTESNRASTRAGQETIIDVQLFTDWLSALDAEQGRVGPAPGYEPDPATYSGFLYARFREEFQPAVEAWVAQDPSTNPAAPPSPFAMDEYVLASSQESQRLEKKADVLAARAHQANGVKDNYVLATVMCASVLFFGGIGAKLASPRLRLAMVGLGAVVLLATLGVLLAYPIKV